MKLKTQIIKWSEFCLLLVVGLQLVGCATSGRRVLLKEYGPTVPHLEPSALNNITIGIKPFAETFSLNDRLPDKNATEPANYSCLKMTPEQVQEWDRDVNARKKASNKNDWKEIGNVRNGFGSVLSKVYAVNPPGQWLADTLKLDLHEQGATIAEGADAANATVSIEGTIRYFKIDIYMTYWADLIVDVTIKVKDKPPIQRTIHTSAKDPAWSSSSFEYFRTIRQCQQKFSRVLIDEIDQALKH